MGLLRDTTPFQKFKYLLTLIALGSLLYFTVFWQVGGRSIAGHVGDVWATPTVQRKLVAIRKDLRLQLGLDEPEPPKKARRRRVRKQQRSDVSDTDRRKLQQLIANTDP